MHRLGDTVCITLATKMADEFVNFDESMLDFDDSLAFVSDIENVNDLVGLEEVENFGIFMG